MYVTNRFSVAAFKILSLTFNSLIIICLSGHLFEFISFLKIHVFHCFWEIFSHYFFRYSFCPFLFLVPFCDPSQCICWSTGWCPTGLLGSVHFISFFFINLFILFILFLAALGLRCCARAFSSCSERRLLLVAVRGLLIAVASLVADHGLQVCGLQQLWHTGLVAPWHVGSFRTRAQTHVPCIGRQILNHCATREALFFSFCSSDSIILIVLSSSPILSSASSNLLSNLSSLFSFQLLHFAAPEFIFGFFFYNFSSLI